jgi:hypothetical protein
LRGNLDWSVGHWRVRFSCGLFLALDHYRLFGLNLPDQPVTFGTATRTIGLGFFDARGVALDTDAQYCGEVEHFFISETELFC